MPIDFPASPTTNQTYTYNNKVWVYSGTAWVGGTVISALPAGSVQMYAAPVTQSTSVGVVTTTAPSGWLLANGDAVSRTTYSTLFAAVGTTYGAGNGSTTFNLPDLRGRLPMGVGTGVGLNASGTGVTSGTAMTARALGAWFGEETHLLTTSELASHTHANTVSGGNTSSAGSHFHSFSKPVISYSAPSGNFSVGTPAGNLHIFSDGDGVNDTNTAVDHLHTFTPSISNVAAGGDSRHATIPPVLVMNFIIKT